MNARIAEFEAIWGRVQVRLSCGKDPREDLDFAWLLSHPPPRLERQTCDPHVQDDFGQIPRPPLVRQTNRHELLSEAARVRYCEARTKEERDAIMIEEEHCPDT